MQYVTDLLKEKAEMLKDYFSIEIGEVHTPLGNQVMHIFNLLFSPAIHFLTMENPGGM